MLDKVLMEEIKNIKRVLYDILPEDVKTERPWLLLLSDDVLLVMSARHLVKYGLYHRELHDILTYIAHMRISFTQEESDIEKQLHLVEPQRFRQTQAQAKMATQFPALYAWLQTPASLAAPALLWHDKQGVFRRI